MVVLSTTAAREIRRLQSLRGQADSVLRLRVASGGCAAWHYVLEWVAAAAPDDCIYLSEGMQIVVDPGSDRHIQALRLDYAEDLMGGGFRFENPQATTTCSCGNSFSR
ncbi:MAG: iron-sulfur cluster assembly accessory protein [Spirulinaceae cyanobacterium SM2_1_0]|nr:iron-sulfur cluster assembly accessory protein [Spirulinaceae cyanobacterium SM2_1_0]